MADDLKRVGLVFKEDGAVDFKKSLQEINLELNKNYNQFKLTQAQWDKSTTSTQKLRAEQEYLKNAYEIQEDKVKTLKMQLSDLENAENKNTTAIKKKRNELTAAEVKLETYNKKIKEIESQLHNTGKKIEEFGEKVQNIGSKIEKAGKKMSVFSAATGTALITSAKSAIDFEDAFTGVEKTVDGTSEQMETLKQGIRDMAKEIPSSTTEISAVAEAAGQLGIKTDDILSFTKVMIDLGNSTNLSAEEAASSLAKFANITKMSAKDYDKLGSTIVDLGNNFATTEADIVDMATRLAATGDLAGLSQPQILSLATAMSSVGIEAEAGGSAMSKLLKNIQVACETGSKDLNSFAKVAGMSSKDFKRAFEKDAVKALSAFISGLNDTKRNGKSAISILEDMGLTEVRLSNTILSLANSGDLMNRAVETGNKAWEDNTALTNEANKRYGTLKSQIQIAINKLKDVAITIGNKLMPYVSKLIKGIEGVAKWFSELNDNQVETIMNIGLVVTAIGPLLTVLGKVTSAVGGTVKGIGTFTQALGVVKGSTSSTSTAVTGLAKVMSAIKSPAGIATIALTGLTAAVVYFATRETEAQKEVREFAEEMSNSRKALEEYNKSIDDTANSNIAQIESSSKLREELRLLVDENGKVKEGYKARVSFILKQLNEALGTEYKLNGDIIEGYKELQSEVDKTIEKKKAEILLTAEEEKYKRAIEEQKQAVEDLRKAKENLGGKTLEQLKIEQKAAEAIGQINNKQAQEIKNRIQAYEDAEYKVKECTENIQTYESDYEQFVSGNYDAINNKISTTTQEWCDKSLEEIKKSIQEKSKALNDYKEIYEKYGNDISKQQMEQAQIELQNLANELVSRTSTVNELGQNEVEAWKQLATNSYQIYSEKINEMEPTMAQKIQDVTGVIINNGTEISSALGKTANSATQKFDNNMNIAQATRENISESSNTIRNDTTVQNAAGNLANRAQVAIKSNNSSVWGQDMVRGLANGIISGGRSSFFTGAVSGLASKIASYLHFSRPDIGPLHEYEEWMPDMVEGLGKSLDKSSPRLIKSVKNMTENMSDELQSIKYGIQGNSNISNNQMQMKVEVDYNKMASAITKALTGCKFTLDEDGFAKIVKDELYKVV